MKISVDKAEGPAKARLIFAHGAGAGKDSPFMLEVTQALTKRGIEVVRFDFPYMQKIAETGKRRPPDKALVLEQTYRDVIEKVSGALPLFIGGKSMGGRIATHVLAGAPVHGAVVLGYPFHPPGKPEKLRTEHLKCMEKPILILQGDRDTFGNQSEIPGYELSDTVSVQFFKDGDHSLKPRKQSGLTQAVHIESAALSIDSFTQDFL